MISGKLGMSSFTQRFEIINPDLVLDASSIGELENGLVAEPVYGLTAGLTGTKLRSMIKTVLGLSCNAEIFKGLAVRNSEGEVRVDIPERCFRQSPPP